MLILLVFVLNFCFCAFDLCSYEGLTSNTDYNSDYDACYYMNNGDPKQIFSQQESWCQTDFHEKAHLIWYEDLNEVQYHYNTVSDHSSFIGLYWDGVLKWTNGDDYVTIPGLVIEENGYNCYQAESTSKVKGINCNSPYELCCKLKAWSCYGHKYYLSSACNGEGDCIDHDDCSCTNPQNTHYNCSEHMCGGLAHYQAGACNDNGDCLSEENCVCYDSRNSNPLCEEWTCNGLLFFDDNVCSGHGTCQSGDNCVCDDVRNTDFNCTYFECHGVPYYENNVCNNAGTCASEDNCVCDAVENTHFNCSEFECYGKVWYSPEVCGLNNGTCSSPNNCVCDDIRNTDPQCDAFQCFGYYWYDTNNVCHGQTNGGTCVSSDNCDCNDNENPNPDCYSYECYGVEYYKDHVCTGVGNCTSENNCVCDDITNIHYKCSLWQCNDIPETNEEVCNYRGNCTAHDNCDCESNFDGDWCQFHYCYTVLNTSTSVCSTKGSCIDVNDCQCDPNYYGDYCAEAILSLDLSVDSNNVISMRYYAPESFYPQTTFDCSDRFVNHEILGLNPVCSVEVFENRVTLLTITLDQQNLVIVGPLIFDLVSSDDTISLNILNLGDSSVEDTEVGVVGGGLDVLIFSISIPSAIALLFISIVAIVSLIVIIVVCCLYQKRKKKFDNLLKEEELEMQENTPNFKINSKLFEINNKDVKLIKLIGEGGANAKLFLAKWQKKDVVLKMFLTKSLAGNGDDFGEFERELNLLSSLSHPNIIVFFGTILQPPRAGIVLEYAENGDVEDYFLKNNNVGLDIRMDICRDVAIAMEFLHSKEVVHRDLKAKNVLLTKELTAKLADFGLSRVIMGKSDLTTRIGTDKYMAPELLSGGAYDSSVDVFAYAIFIWEVLNDNFKPYGMIPNIERKVANDPNLRPSLVNLKQYGEDWLCNVIGQCWSHESSARLRFSDIVKEFEKNKNC